MNMPSTPLDALTFPLHGSRLIEASAGTGKTFTIALLYVRLVLNHGRDDASFGRPLSPPEILVVTFTDAATQELRERIRARLAEAAGCFSYPEGEHDAVLVRLRAEYPDADWPGCAHRLRMAAEWMDEAAVSTIHAWCYRMLREHAFDSGSLFRMELSTDQNELLAETVRDYWRRNFYPLNPDAAKVVRQCFASPAELFGAVKALLPHENSTFRFGGAELGAPASLHGVLKEAGDLSSRIDALDSFARKAWRQRREEVERVLHLIRPHLHGNSYKGRSDDAVFGGWLAALGLWSEGGEIPANLHRFSQTGFRLTKGEAAPIHPAFEAIDVWLDLKNQGTDVRPHILLHAAAQVRLMLEMEKQHRAELGFDDLLTRLDRALGADAGGRFEKRIREQFPIALIDEFQDTDPVQYRIFERIYQISTCPRESGLFLIGDPKQAIYAFRGADIHTYLQARKATEGRHYSLGKNYRSTPSLVEAVNHCFGFAEKHERGAFRYAKAGARNPVPFHAVSASGTTERLMIDGTEASALTLWRMDDEGAVVGAGAYRQRMAEHSASAICEWLVMSKNGRAGFLQANGRLQLLRPADIAILVRDRIESDAVRTELRKRGLASVYLSDKDSVFDTQEAEDLLRCLQACAEPTDDGLLRLALASQCLDLSWQTLDRLNQDERFWETMVLRFRNYHTLWQRQGVLPMVRRLLADFDLPACLMRRSDGERRLTNLLHLAEWLQRESGQLDGEHALLRLLSDQIKNKSEEEILRLESDADLIKVVTIHKSKGLEYPLVLLPFACSWKEFNGRSKGLLSFRAEDQSGVIVELENSGDVKEARAARNDERLNEDVRLLYVALTRARHAVWMGIAPLVSGNASKSELHKGAIGYVLNGGLAIEHAELDTRLADLRAGCDGIAVAAAPISAAAYTPDALPALEPARTSPSRTWQSWSVASYSGLAISKFGGDAPLVSIPEPANALEENLRQELKDADVIPLDRKAPSTENLHGFPRGTKPGSFLHGLLEWAAREGFVTLSSSTARLREQIKKKCEQWGIDQNWVARLTSWLLAAVETPLRLTATSATTLTGLGMYQTEMEFWFAVDHVDIGALDRLVCAHVLVGESRPPLQPKQVNGMFKGFIDLVFEHEGQYFVADYKSNRLGANDAAYGRPAMQAEVLKHRYDMQYALYVFALHRLLRSRLPDYDYERDVGGAVYIFLRGLQASSQGLFLQRPPADLMDALDALFGARVGLEREAA